VPELKDTALVGLNQPASELGVTMRTSPEEEERYVRGRPKQEKVQITRALTEKDICTVQQPSAYYRPKVSF